jgi:PAS domain S-box-containing protein
MTAHPHRLAGRPPRSWPTLGRPATIALALALFVTISTLRVSDPNAVNSDEVLFVLPIALLALRFGLRGGLAGALVGLAIMVASDYNDQDLTSLSVRGYLSWTAAFLLLGTLLGMFVENRRKLEAQISRYYDASIDLLATADLSGRFMRFNAAWERTLGHPPETMRSRNFMEFVHPDDRESSAAEMVDLIDGSRDTIGFRHRFRAADGTYRWLEWNASLSPSEGVMHAVGRDISAQHEAEEQLAASAELLEARVAERTRELDAARAETLQLLASAAEYRDDDTSKHTERVGVSAAEIAERLGLDAEQIGLLREAAPLHDVGKLAISDTILLKPGKLTAQEYEVMKTHAELGARLLSGSKSPVLRMAAVIAAAHHERWDGRGYPAGLAGKAIPLVGRIVAVADVFDALTHDRPYKSAWPPHEAVAEIQRGAGSQFDARVVAAFLMIQSDVVVETDGPRQRRRMRGATRPPLRSGHYVEH